MQTVVSGEIEPDTIEAERTSDGTISLGKNVIGSKKLQIIMSDQNNTKTMQMDQEKSNRLCLTEDQILLLGKVGLEIENAYGSPRDIEWAFYQVRQLKKLASSYI